MNMVFVCRSALADSCISNLFLAMEAKKMGKDVAVLFTEEALLAVVNGVFRWSPQLTPQNIRLRLADRAANLNLPVMGSGVGKQLDTKEMIRRGKEAGITMLACSPWVELLGLEDKLPAGITKGDTALILKMIEEAHVIVSSP